MNNPVGKIIQWNLDSWKSKFSDLSILFTKYSPEVVALQETKLHPGYNTDLQFKQYSIYRKDRDARGGGVALLVMTKIPHLSVPLQTNLEAIATKISFENTQLTICNIYIPTVRVLPSQELNNLIQQLTPPYLIVGDFNCKHPLWGSPVADNKGVQLEEIVSDNAINVLNTGKPTHYLIHNNYHSHLDLSLCSPDISDSFNWDTADDLYHSHHYPIIISHSEKHYYTTSPKKWNIRQSTIDNWKAFKSNVNLPQDFQNQNIACQAIIDHIIDIASLHLKKKLRQN